MAQRQRTISVLLVLVILFSAIRSWKVLFVTEALSTEPWYQSILMVLCLPVAWVLAVIGCAQILLQRGSGLFCLALSAILFFAGALIFGTVLSFIPFLTELLPISLLTPILLGLFNLVMVYLLWILGRPGKNTAL